MKYYIKTFGCQMNFSDSERIAGFLEMHKIKPAENINQADLVIFNTCGVRQSAEDRVYGQIHNIRKQEERSRKKAKKILIITGCLANRRDVISRLKYKVDIFLSINKLINLPYFINQLKTQSSKRKTTTKNFELKIQDTRYQIPDTSKQNCSYLKIKPNYANFHTALVPIMTGCNNFCSYCVVPFARGTEVSRPAEDIILEIETLIKKGCKEIVLLGQNVNSYKDGNISFSDLLKKVNNLPGNFWISFISNHPKDFSDELIETMSNLKKVCEYVHLPIQAGDNNILEKMNRKYTAKQYLMLVNKIKKAFRKYKPGKLYAITSDIIVGFPGETREQFLKSADIMKKVGYDMVYFGQFSPRPGTVAWKMRDNVSKKGKERRENYLNEILKKTSLENNKKYLGKTAEVLITDKKGQFYFGHTRTMKNVKFVLNKKGLIGNCANVKIIKVTPWNLSGKLISK